MSTQLTREQIEQAIAEMSPVELGELIESLAKRFDIPGLRALSAEPETHICCSSEADPKHCFTCGREMMKLTLSTSPLAQQADPHDELVFDGQGDAGPARAEGSVVEEAKKKIAEIWSGDISDPGQAIEDYALGLASRLDRQQAEPGTVRVPEEVLAVGTQAMSDLERELREKLENGEVFYRQLAPHIKDRPSAQLIRELLDLLSRVAPQPPAPRQEEG